MALLANVDVSNPWDVAFQILLFIIALTIAHRYGMVGQGWKGWKSALIVGPLIIIVYLSVSVFCIGTANGTSLEHPFWVLLYMVGGAFVVVALDSAVKAIDKWLREITHVAEEE